MTDVLQQQSKTLSVPFINKIIEPGKYHDGGGVGLYLRVESSGNKFWVQGIMINGKRRELGLGSYPLIKLAKAREQALENKREVKLGSDPLKTKKDSRLELTFEEATRKVYELDKPTWSNEKHKKQFITTLETYAFPKIGHYKPSDITPADVLSVLTPIWTTKGQTAKRVRQRIGRVMTWCVTQGLSEYNPAESVLGALPKIDGVQKHRKALPYSQVPACIKAIQNSKAQVMNKLALELLILTATRSGEIRLAQWEEFNLNYDAHLSGPIWSIPSVRMKTKKPHRIPLADRSLEILNQAMVLSDNSGLVFPGRRPGKPLSNMTLSKLVKNLGYDADVHGFRTSFKTWAQEQTDFTNEASEMALAHSIKNKTEAAYARSDLLNIRTELMNQWTEYISG